MAFVRNVIEIKIVVVVKISFDIGICGFVLENKEIAALAVYVGSEIGFERVSRKIIPDIREKQCFLPAGKCLGCLVLIKEMTERDLKRAVVIDIARNIIAERTVFRFHIRYFSSPCGSVVGKIDNTVFLSVPDYYLVGHEHRSVTGSENNGIFTVFRSKRDHCIGLETV